MSWVKAYNGDVPEHAVLGGFEFDGRALYVARSSYEGGLHPGKVGSHLGGCMIPFGEKEIVCKEYEVLVAPPKDFVKIHWIRKETPDVPEYSLEAGHEKDGKQLYVARGKLEGGLHLGKCGPSLPDGMHAAYGGEVKRPSPYEILVFHDFL